MHQNKHLSFNVYIKCSKPSHVQTLTANVTDYLTLIKCYKPQRARWCRCMSDCVGRPEAAEKSLTERSSPPFVSFNSHPFLNWSHFQAYYCRHRGSGCKEAPQGHEAHPCVPEWTLSIRMQRGKAEHLTPIVSAFGHISLSHSCARAELHFLQHISVSETKPNTTSTQRHTHRQTVVALWAHQECCSSFFQKGVRHTRTLPHCYISVFIPAS